MTGIHNLESFASHQREAFNGLALAIIRSESGKTGKITVKAKSIGLKETPIELQSK
jgi:beta-galactosidase